MWKLTFHLLLSKRRLPNKSYRLTFQNGLSRNGPIGFANVSYSQSAEAETALNILKFKFGFRAKRNTPKEVREQEKQARMREEKYWAEEAKNNKKV